jgi:hypothetical protein
MVAKAMKADPGVLLIRSHESIRGRKNSNEAGTVLPAPLGRRNQGGGLLIIIRLIRQKGDVE